MAALERCCVGWYSHQTLQPAAATTSQTSRLSLAHYSWRTQRGHLQMCNIHQHTGTEHLVTRVRPELLRSTNHIRFPAWSKHFNMFSGRFNLPNNRTEPSDNYSSKRNGFSTAISSHHLKLHHLSGGWRGLARDCWISILWLIYSNLTNKRSSPRIQPGHLMRSRRQLAITPVLLRASTGNQKSLILLDYHTPGATWPPSAGPQTSALSRCCLVIIRLLPPWWAVSLTVRCYHCLPWQSNSSRLC